MPTTTSLVRGNTTVTGNGSSSVTLFTQGASGIAARVIVNQLGFYGTSTASNYNTYGALFINGSGVGETCIGGVFLGSTTGSGSLLSVIPSQGGSSAYGANQNGVIGNSGYFPNLNGVPTASYTAGRINANQLPQSFWIGPSDAVTAKAYFYAPSGKTIAPSTVTVRYSFTIILES